MKLNSSLKFSHYILKNTINKGDTVIDGTVGNGNDTLFMNNLVGKNGTILGFDIQEQAIHNTKIKLHHENETANIKLYHTGHENISKYTKNQKINAAIFNLGYLPGGDKNIITHANTTIKAINACLKIIQKLGIIILVVYYGHPGGEDEKNNIENYVSKLNQKKYSVLKYQFINQIHEPPILIAIQKR